MSATSPLPLLLPAVDLSDVEQATEQVGYALEQALLPLFHYCEKSQGRAELTDYQFQHIGRIRAALNAVAAYATQVEQLLTAMQANVTGLNRQLHHAYSNRPQTLETAMRVDWESIALRLLERLRAAGLETPASPLVMRIQRHLDSPGAQAYATLPLNTRRYLNSLTTPSVPLAHAA